MPGRALDENQPGEWRPPKRKHLLPDAGVVALEPQPDEEQAFEPAAGWRLSDGRCALVALTVGTVWTGPRPRSDGGSWRWR